MFRLPELTGSSTYSSPMAAQAIPTAPMPETASWFAAPVLVGVEGDPAAAPGCPAALDGAEIDALDDALWDADAVGSISISRL